MGRGAGSCGRGGEPSRSRAGGVLPAAAWSRRANSPPVSVSNEACRRTTGSLRQSARSDLGSVSGSGIAVSIRTGITRSGTSRSAHSSSRRAASSVWRPVPSVLQARDPSRSDQRQQRALRPDLLAALADGAVADRSMHVAFAEALAEPVGEQQRVAGGVLRGSSETRADRVRTCRRPGARRAAPSGSRGQRRPAHGHRHRDRRCDRPARA